MSSSTFAEQFERVLVPAIFRPWAADLLDRVGPQAGDRILDVACGTGVLGRLLVQRGIPERQVAGIDLNSDMITLARSLAPGIDWRVANASQLPFTDGSFDLVLCQQGLQFFPDRATAVREMGRVLVTGGRVALSTWRPLAENPLYLALHELSAAQFGPHPDRRFSFGEAGPLRALLVDAGFRDVHTATVMRMERLPDARTFVAMNLGAAAPGLDDLDAASRAEAMARFQDAAEPVIARFAEGDGLVYPASANFVTARR